MSVADTLDSISKSSFFSNTMSAVNSAVTSVASVATTCFSSAMNGISVVAGSISSATCRAITFSASVVSAHPKISKAAVGALALIGAAYVGRGYYPAFKATISK
jgi:hypothetical protein